MREYKFRAWAKKTYDHYISDPIEKAYTEFEDSEPDDSYSDEWTFWYGDRKRRVEELSEKLNPNAEDRFEITYEMIEDFSIKGNGKLAAPYRYEIIDVMQDTGQVDKSGIKIYSGDFVIIYDGEEERFEVKWDNFTSRFIMKSDALSVDFDNYFGYECEVIGNIYENPELIIE